MSCASSLMATAVCGWCGLSRWKPTRTGSSSIATSTWMICASTRRRRCAVPPDRRPVQSSTVLARSIGIGGHLAVPPLPHHRAYGPVPRRFGGLSTHQLFHRKQTQTTEASFGEGAMQRCRRAQSPRSLWAEDGRTGRPFGDVKASELAIALTARLPLNPDDATQAPSDPAIQRWQLAPLAEAEVPGPSPHKRVQVGDHLLQADAPMSPRQFANPVLEPGHGLVGDASPEAWVILDPEAEERPVPRSGDGTLLRIDLQFEAPFDEAGQARHDPSASVSDVDVAVIRVPHKTVAATLKLAIQFIQDEVREQGRERTALRRPFPALLEQPAIERPGGQVSPDQPEDAPIRDPRRRRGH